MSPYKQPHFYMTKIFPGFLPIVLKRLGFWIIFVVSIFSIQSHANATNMSEREKQLLNSCDTLNANPTHPNALVCIYYIQGYLAGAWGVNDVKASKLKKKKQEPLTRTERAYKTRVGKRGERIKPISTTYFCAPDDEPEVQILKNLTKNLVTPTKSILALHAQIYTAITEVCPSDKSDDK